MSIGLALRASGDNEGARLQMESAAQLLESVRYDQRSPEARSNIYELQTSCYHILQQIFVAMQRNEEALVAAERCKARSGPDASNVARKAMMTCSEHIYDIVNRTKNNVLYFSLATDELYAWFLQPQKGIVRFHAVKISEESLKISSEKLAEHAKGAVERESLLERYINMVRDNLGVNSDSVLHEGDGSGWRASTENLLDDFSSERSGFLRMVNRNHLMNSSNYSLSSLFSLGSVGGSVASLQGSTRSIGSLQGSSRSRRTPTVWQGPSCLHTLFNILMAPFDDLLPTGGAVSRQGRKELILVLDNELYLVPFAILRSSKEDGEYLSERCSLITVPSLQSLRVKSKALRSRELAENLNAALVVGGPRIPATLAETWGWSESPASLQEAAMVADMLQAKTLAGCNATKEAVISELPTAECVHFAANLSWKLGAVVLSPGDVVDSQSQKRFYQSSNSENATGPGNEPPDLSGGNMELPQLSDFILSAADVLNIKLNAKLVVLSSYHSIEPISGSGVANLAGSWLCAGAGAVLISLWPVPETAAKILLRAFYSALLQGARAARYRILVVSNRPVYSNVSFFFVF